MPREVNLRIELLRKQRRLTSVQLAKRIGVSETTLRSYRTNQWTVLDRSVLEAFADIFQCDAASLLETKQTQFFDAFRAHPNCVYVRRHDAPVERSGRKVAHRDYSAIHLIEDLLSKWVENVAGDESSPTTPDDFDKLLSENCIVVGSPVV